MTTEATPDPRHCECCYCKAQRSPGRERGYYVVWPNGLGYPAKPMFWDGQSWKDVAGPIYFGLAFSSPLVAVKISVATVSP